MKKGPPGAVAARLVATHEHIGRTSRYLKCQMAADLTYQQRVTATVDAQLKRAEANQLFREGDLSGAVVAYKAALAEAVLDEDRLPLLSNIGFCHLKLAAPEPGTNFKVQAELQEASECLLRGLALGAACFHSPVLGAKVAGRFLEVCRRTGDFAGERAAVAECHFYMSVALEKGLKPPALELPQLPDPSDVTALLMAVGTAGEDGGDDDADDEGIDRVREALTRANGEAFDEHRMHALCLAVHISCLRPKLGTSLLRVILDAGTPVDARHENGRTALMLSANNGRLDLCTLLLDAGASAAAVDGEGASALHACCHDLHLAGERAEAGVESNPAACVALLLTRGANVAARSVSGETALSLCDKHRTAHAAAEACATLLQEWQDSKTLEVTRL